MSLSKNAKKSTAAEKTSYIETLQPVVKARYVEKLKSIAVGQDALRSSAPTAVVSLLLKRLCRKRRTFAYIKEANGLFQLKRNHPYYLQVQCQIFVTGNLFCDFVVFTEKALPLVVVRIMPDSTAWEAVLQKAKYFFQQMHFASLDAGNTM